jgi:hypothetical protein
MTPNVFNFPSKARNAAGGITISLGTGRIELSIAMSKMIPTYPHCSTHSNQI